MMKNKDFQHAKKNSFLSMKNILPYILTAGITVNACTSEVVDDNGIEQTTEQTKTEWVENQLDELCVYEPNNIQTSLIEKIDTIESVSPVKVQDYIFLESDYENNKPFAIYKFTNPNNEEIKLISLTDNFFRGELHSIRYLSLNKGESISHDEITGVYYGLKNTANRQIKDIDGILLSHNRIRSE